MPAFNLEHEQRRLQEAGLTFDTKVRSTKDNLRTLVAERTGAPSFFEMRVHDSLVTSTGYEQRGDLGNSFSKSEEEAQTEVIARRYGLENKGYERVKDRFGELPLYSTVLLFSPPPDEPIPGYPGHSFAYFYHILPGEKEGERTIKALAWVNRFSKEDQSEILNNLQREEKVLPSEQSILTSPISVLGEGSFKKIWEKMRQYYDEKEYSGFTCPNEDIMKDYLLNGDRIMRSRFAELDIMQEDLAKRLARGEGIAQIREDFDTMLKRGDKDWLHKDWGKLDSIHMNVPVLLIPKDAGIIFALNKNNDKVRQVMTFCGLSSGLSKNDSQINSWSFTVKTDQNKTSEQTKLCCTCPFCNKQVEAEIGGGRIVCPNCKKSASWKN